MNIIELLEAEHAAKLIEGKKIPEFRPGDTVIVNVKVKEGERSRVQAYEGVVISRQGGGLNESFTVRKISYGEGVERVFPLHGPLIELDQARAPRQGAPRQALLSARPPRQVRPHRRARRNQESIAKALKPDRKRGVEAADRTSAVLLRASRFARSALASKADCGILTLQSAGFGA